MALQTEIAYKIISMLRSGQVNGPVGGKSFDKVIVSPDRSFQLHVAHRTNNI